MLSERKFLSVYTPGKWVMIPDDFIRTFDTDVALILAYMVNLDWLAAGYGEESLEKAQKRKERYRKKKGWVPLTRQMLEHRYGLNSYKQNRILSKLEKLGAIKLGMVGKPAKRHFFLVEERIEELIVNKIQDRKSATLQDRKSATPIYREEQNIEEVPASSRRRATEDLPMGLGGVHIPGKQPEGSPLNEVDTKRATILREGLKSKSIGLARGWSKKTWAKEFRFLRIAYPDCDLDSILNWYLANIGKEYIPQAFSAKSFRLKFNKIIAAKERADRDNPNVVITDKAEKIYQSISHLNWPSGTGDELRQAVQITLTTYQNTLNTLAGILERIPEKVNGARNPLHKLVTYISDGLPTSSTFVTNWVRDLHSVASHFKNNWKGKFIKSAPKKSTDRSIQDLINGLANSFGTSQTTIELMWKELS